MSCWPEREVILADDRCELEASVGERGANDLMMAGARVRMSAFDRRVTVVPR
jgi:hypothetical protein